VRELNFSEQNVAEALLGAGLYERSLERWDTGVGIGRSG
jgi:hypothetical protein